MSISDEERAAFDLEQMRAMGDLNCSHDQAWLDAWLVHERRATVERIRAVVGGSLYNFNHYGTEERAHVLADALVAVLDEEAAR